MAANEGRAYKLPEKYPNRLGDGYRLGRAFVWCSNSQRLLEIPVAVVSETRLSRPGSSHMKWHTQFHFPQRSPQVLLKRQENFGVFVMTYSNGIDGMGRWPW